MPERSRRGSHAEEADSADPGCASRVPFASRCGRSYHVLTRGVHRNDAHRAGVAGLRRTVAAGRARDPEPCCERARRGYTHVRAAPSHSEGGRRPDRSGPRSTHSSASEIEHRFGTGLVHPFTERRHRRRRCGSCIGTGNLPREIPRSAPILDTTLATSARGVSSFRGTQRNGRCRVVPPSRVRRPDGGFCTAGRLAGSRAASPGVGVPSGSKGSRFRTGLRFGFEDRRRRRSGAPR